MRIASLIGGLTDLSLVPAAASVDRVLHFNHHIHLYDEFDICFSRILLKNVLCCWKLHQFVIVKYLNNPGPQLMQFCKSSQLAFELETLRTPLDIKTPIKMLLSHGSGSTDMISVQQTPKKGTLVLGDHSWIALGGSEAFLPVLVCFRQNGCY